MSEQIAQVQKVEHRTRSELLREARRRYFESRFPEEMPTKADLAAIKRGRAAIKRGDFVTLNQLQHELDAARHQASKKRTRKTAQSSQLRIERVFDQMVADPFSGDIKCLTGHSRNVAAGPEIFRLNNTAPRAT